MTIERARKVVILASLIITGVQMLFLIVAPSVGFPLSYPKNLDLLQIVSPVFLGYLGAATHFIFRNPPPTVPAQNEYLGFLVIGPLVIYVMAVGGAFAAFGYSNRVGAALGEGMTQDNLATALSFALSLLAATVGVISSYLFVAQRNAAEDDGNRQGARGAHV
jgi:hypothetical protein